MHLRSFLKAAGIIIILFSMAAVVGLRKKDVPEPAPTQVSVQPFIKKQKEQVTYLLPDLKGNYIKSSQSQKSIEVILFWSTWGPIDKKLFDYLSKLDKHYPSHIIDVTIIALDDNAKDVEDYMGKQKLIFQCLRVDRDLLYQQSWIKGVPSIFILDQSHRIIEKMEGAIKEDLLDKKIIELLEKKGKRRS